MGALRWIELDSLDNIVSIVAATLIASYTCDADRIVFADIYAQQVQGNGDYVYYATKTPSGLSEGVIGPKTTQPLAAGETILCGQSIGVSLRSGDVLKIYLKGVSGDNGSVIDTRVNFYEDAALQPATLDATIQTTNLDAAISSRAAAGNAMDLIDDAVDAGAIKVDAVTKIQSGLSTLTAAQVDTNLSAAHGSGSWEGASGSGSVEFIYTVTNDDSGLPVAQTFVWCTTDIGGDNVVGSGYTDDFGDVMFYLDPGTYYFWRKKSGYNFENPDTEMVT